MASGTEDYVKALKKIRDDPTLSHKFMQDPHGTLKSLGVTVGRASSAQGSAQGADALSICVGACVCVG